MMKQSLPSIQQNCTVSTKVVDTNLLEQLLQISRNFAQIRDTQTLLNYAVDEVMRLVGAERGYILLVNEYVMQTSPSIEEYLFAPNSIEFQVRRRSDGTDIHSGEDLISRNVLNYVLEKRSALVTSDALTDARFAGVESVMDLRLRSIMCVPLIFQNNLIGAIYVENRTLAEQFSTESLAPLEYFSYQVAVVINRLRLDEEHQRLQEQYFQSQKMEALGQLSGGIAHEFNNLLVPIIAYAELSKIQLAESNQVYTYMDTIHDCALRAESLIRQILGYSRKTVMDPSPVQLEVIVSQFSELLDGLLADSIEVEIQLEQDQGAFLGNKNQIEQLLLNLVINARDAMQGRGKIVIETLTTSKEKWANISATEQFFGGQPPRANYVALKVHDTGHGINSNDLELIFEPFFTTKGPDEGTGLGLATVFAITQQQKGYISVASEVGVGSTFSIYLPQADETVTMCQEETHYKKPSLGSILIVDDNDLIREALCEVLLEYNYGVYKADTPQDAIEILQQNLGQIDLVITDVIMPKCNGYELYQQIKEIDPVVDILLMSGHTSDILTKNGITLEEISFIQKPFSIQKLLDKINESVSVSRKSTSFDN